MKQAAAATTREFDASDSFAAGNAAAYASPAALGGYSKHTGLWDVESRLIATHFRADRAVLDLGCGGGRTTAALRQLGFAVTGVDLSKPLLDVARRTVRDAEFVHADVRELPFADGTFDQALFSFNGIDCVCPAAELRRAWSEIRRVLRPGGVFVYSGHNILGFFGRHLRSLRALVAGVREHPEYLLLQRRGARHRDWYWRYAHSYGEVVLFSAPPWVHRRLHGELGFETIEVCGPEGPHSEPWLTWFEAHMQYVVRKR